MKHQLPEHVRLAFARIARATPTARLVMTPEGLPEESAPRERWQRAEAILNWTWWLSRWFPRGLSRVPLYSAEGLSLWLEASGEVKLINSCVTAMAKGVTVRGPRDLEQALWGEHLDRLAEAILVGTIWDVLLRDLERTTGPAQEGELLGLPPACSSSAR